MSGLRRSGGTYVANGKKFEYSLAAMKSYPWGVMPLDATGGIAKTPIAIWFKTREHAESYAKVIQSAYFNFGYVVGKAHL